MKNWSKSLNSKNGIGPKNGRFSVTLGISFDYYCISLGWKQIEKSK